jgi:hypothetical protein
MIKLKNLIKENSKSTYDYGCVMLYFTFPEIKKIHSLISPSDIYTEESDNTFGLEDEPHTTLLYGLHEGVSNEDVERVLGKFTFGDLKSYNPSLFENEKYDVLKYDVGYPTRGGAFLHKANNELKKLPHTTSFPKYHPHLTIGYLKKGEGQNYVNMLNKAGLTEYRLEPQYGVYSKPDGSKSYIQLCID